MGRFVVFIGAAAFVSLGVASVGRSQGDQATSSVLQTLRREVDEANDAFRKASGREPEHQVDALWEAYVHKAETNYLKALEEVRKSPSSSEAFSALVWIASDPRTLSLPYSVQAISILNEHHARNPKVGTICSVIGYYGDQRSEPMLTFLRKVAQQNPDRTTRGQALLGLGRLLWRRVRNLDHPKPYNARPDYREAERLLNMVTDQYDDCPDLRTVGIRQARRTLGESAKDELFEMHQLIVGKTAPEIVGGDIDGKRLKLSDFRGKVVVLVFWATWCGPCMGMIPHEQKLVERMKGKPFVLIGVNGDESRDIARKAVGTNEISWRSFWNGGSNGPITDAWNIQQWPTIYVLDADGVIRFKQLREKRLDEVVDLLIQEVATKLNKDAQEDIDK